MRRRMDPCDLDRGMSFSLTEGGQPYGFAGRRSSGLLTLVTGTRPWLADPVEIVLLPGECVWEVR